MGRQGEENDQQSRERKETGIEIGNIKEYKMKREQEENVKKYK